MAMCSKDVMTSEGAEPAAWRTQPPPTQLAATATPRPTATEQRTPTQTTLPTATARPTHSPSLPTSADCGDMWVRAQDTAMRVDISGGELTTGKDGGEGDERPPTVCVWMVSGSTRPR